MEVLGVVSHHAWNANAEGGKLVAGALKGCSPIKLS